MMESSASLEDLPTNSTGLPLNVEHKHVALMQACVRRYLALKRRKDLASLNRRRKAACMELWTTEKTYCNQLKILSQVYKPALMEYWKDNSKRVELTFSNVEELLSLSESLLVKFKDIAHNRSTIGFIISPYFSHMISNFACYSTYCSNYDSAVEFLQREKERDPQLKPFLVSTQKSKESSVSTDFSALLISPVQRLPRYKLLLKEILSNTPEDYQDYHELKETLHQLKETIFDINNQIEIKQNNFKISILQTQLIVPLELGSFWLYKEGRIFIKEGPVFYIGNKKQLMRFLILFSDVLLICEQRPYGMLYLCRILTTSGLKIISIEDKPERSHAIQILSKEKSFTICPETGEEKHFWMFFLKKSTIATQPHEPGKSDREDSVAPIWIRDEESLVCMKCQAPFSLLRRRHHCRKCGAVVCGTCSAHQLVITAKGAPKRVCDDCYGKSDQSKADLRARSSSNPTVPKSSQDELPTVEFKERRRSSTNQDTALSSENEADKTSDIERYGRERKMAIKVEENPMKSAPTPTCTTTSSPLPTESPSPTSLAPSPSPSSSSSLSSSTPNPISESGGQVRPQIVMGRKSGEHIPPITSPLTARTSPMRGVASPRGDHSPGRWVAPALSPTCNPHTNPGSPPFFPLFSALPSSFSPFVPTSSTPANPTPAPSRPPVSPSPSLAVPSPRPNPSDPPHNIAHPSTYGSTPVNLESSSSLLGNFSFFPWSKPS